MWKSGLEEEIAQKGYGADDTLGNEHAISVIDAILDEQQCLCASWEWQSKGHK